MQRCLLLGILALSCMSFHTTIDSLPIDTGKNVAQKPLAPPTKKFKSLLPRNQTAVSTSTKNVSQVLPNNDVVGFKDAYIQREKLEMERMKKWGRPYFSIYDKILGENGLPIELKYLSVIESSLVSTTRSSAGAVGPWQLMYDEAMRFGLRVDENGDERTNFYKSTQAASMLLKELFKRYGDWLLVIAAYNAGPGAVNRAIVQTGSADFWKLQYHLPEETRNHVKKYISTHYYFEGNGGVTTMTKQEMMHYRQRADAASRLSRSTPNNTDSILVRGLYNSGVICRFLNYNQPEFELLNPDFDQEIALGKDYLMRLPETTMLLFKKYKSAILEDCFNHLMR